MYGAPLLGDDGAVSGALHDALAARDEHDWQLCFDVARHAGPLDDERVEADRLDLMADAAWWLGRLDECIEARELAYRTYDDLGEDRRAG